MRLARLALALAGVGLVLAGRCRTPPTPGPPARTSTSASRCWPISSTCPPRSATSSASYPFDFLYGNIAADSSIAKHYAPLGRHCHYWHVGQEIHDLAGSDALRAFALGYLCHLSADTVAHNYFVPRQLMLTSSTAAVGHTRTGRRGSRAISATPTRRRPRTSSCSITARRTRTSTGSSRRPSSACEPTGVCSAGWCGSPKARAGSSPLRWRGSTAAGRSRTPTSSSHLGLSFDFMVEFLRGPASPALQLDPSGERPLKSAKEIRRKVMRNGGRRPGRAAGLRRARSTSGFPSRPLDFWPTIPVETAVARARRMRRRLPVCS